MNRILLSREEGALCAQSICCFPSDGNLKVKKKWIESRDLFTDDTGRVFALVDTESRVFFMDAITGSLYQFGTCLTSDILTVRNIRRNHAVAADTLLLPHAPSQSDNDAD